MLVSDLLLAWLDPRIRIGGGAMNEPLPLKQHYVDLARPSIPARPSPSGAESESFYRASSWRLMWWKFRRHKVAVAAAFILLAFYAMVPFVEMIAPYNQTKRHGEFLYAPPQSVHLMHEGRLVGPSSIPTSSPSTSRASVASTPSILDAAADPVPVPRRWLRFLGPRARRRASLLPARERHDVPPRHGQARPRPALAHHLRRADLAHHRHRRHRGVVHARHCSSADSPAISAAGSIT